MADEADMANEQLDSELSRAIVRIRNSAPAGQGTRLCADCGDDVPAVRRELGFRFCISCAESRERRRALFANE